MEEEEEEEEKKEDQCGNEVRVRGCE